MYITHNCSYWQTHDTSYNHISFANTSVPSIYFPKNKHCSYCFSVRCYKHTACYDGKFIQHIAQGVLPVRIRWRTVLLGFSGIATCSVADCERKHGDHKRLASGSSSTSFMSLTVQSVLDEARTSFLRLQRHAQGCRKLGSGEDLVPAKPVKVNPRTRDFEIKDKIHKRNVKREIHVLNYCISTMFERAKLSCLGSERDWCKKEVCACATISALIHDEMVGFGAHGFFSQYHLPYV